MENETTTAPAPPPPSPLAPVVERFAVPLLWLAAGWAIGRFMRPSRRAAE